MRIIQRMEKPTTLKGQVSAVIKKYPHARTSPIITKWVWAEFYKDILVELEGGWALPLKNYTSLPSQESIGRAMREIRAETTKAVPKRHFGSKGA
jgi:hypothetical protein